MMSSPRLAVIARILIALDLPAVLSHAPTVLVSIIGLVFAATAASGSDCASPPQIAFHDPVSNGTCGLPRAIALGDFDGDGAIDFAVACPSGLTAHRNEGKASFAEPLFLYVPGRGAESVASADFNGDGRDDLAAAVWFLVAVREIDPATIELNGHPLTEPRRHSHSMRFGRVNADDLLDLILSVPSEAIDIRQTDRCVIVTARLRDGSKIVGGDEVRVTGAHRAGDGLAFSETDGDAQVAPQLKLLEARTGVIRLKIMGAGGNQKAIDVFDAFGRRLLSQSSLSGEDILLTSKALAPGIYLLRLARGREVMRMKVAIAR